MTNRSENLAYTASWLAPAQALHDFGTAAVLSLVPLFFMRAPTAVWVGAIVELIREFRASA
ncbi:MAG TPA: hypothetical protein VMT87_11635 [Vicinamibacteria bacterium]|nr:hypothetical protein [Vicinamibacteria bacterium]